MLKAEEAKRLLLEDRERGEHVFDELLKDYPYDGMVYFKRAEGWESLQQWVLALSDYGRAATRFPMETWREKARQRVRLIRERLERETNGTNGSDGPDCDFFKRAPQIQKIAQEGKEKIGADPRAALVSFRMVIEVLVDALARDHRIAFAQPDSLATKIRHLVDGGVTSSITASHMNTCRVLGNEAAHNGLVTKADAEVSWKALQAICRKTEMHDGEPGNKQ